MDSVLSLLREPVPSLEEIASFKVAIALIRRHLDTEEPPLDRDDNFYVALNPAIVEPLVEHLTVPSCIKNTIKAHLNSIVAEMYQWLENFNGSIYAVPFYLSTRERLRCYAWQPNGKIDDQKTARNLCSGFTAEGEFEIMCKYYLKDDLDKLSLDVLSLSQFDYYNSYPLLNYWICYKKNELYKIPVDESVSVEEYMLCHENAVIWSSWASAEYFWDRLPVEKQSDVVQRLILDDGQAVLYLRPLLARMTDSQRHTVLVSVPYEIVKDFWVDMMEVEIGHAIWTYVKDTISEEGFAKLVRILSQTELGFQGSDASMNFLVDLWNSAADNLKNYVLEHTFEKILEFHFHPLQDSTRCNMKFLKCILSSASLKFKKNLLSMHGSKYPYLMEELKHLI